jgi:alanine dehydrogenase
MIVGIPRETKAGELRVALEPAAVAALAGDGHAVRVERGAGAGVGYGDDAYRAAGAQLASTREAWSGELVVKVKEVQPEDLPAIPRGARIFSFHHLPGEPERARALAARGVTAIAFEMVRDAAGRYPLLAPMSAIAGRMAIDVAERHRGARAGRVLVLGAGHAGFAAAREAASRGAQVSMLTRSARSCDAARDAGFQAGIASAEAVEREALAADVIVGAVFVAGEPTPKLISREWVRRMRRGSMIVDVSIDAGGVSETSRPTTHGDPTYVDEGVIHYAVANMPAALPREGTAALSAAALPFVREIAAKGVARAARENAALSAGILMWKGAVNHPGIAQEAGLPYTPLSDSDLA